MRTEDVLDSIGGDGTVQRESNVCLCFRDTTVAFQSLVGHMMVLSTAFLSLLLPFRRELYRAISCGVELVQTSNVTSSDLTEDNEQEAQQAIALSNLQIRLSPTFFDNFPSID